MSRKTAKSPNFTREPKENQQKPKIFSPFIPAHQPNTFNDPNELVVPLNIPQKSTKSPTKKRPIIDMTIDIGGNTERKIMIFEGDDCKSLARQFCIENNLDLRCCELISQEIEKQIKGYYEKKGQEIRQKIKTNNPPRKKQKSLHNVNEDSKKLKKNLSVKSFREDSDDEFHTKSEKNIGKFNKLTEFPSRKESNYSFKPKINGPGSLFYDEGGDGKRYETLYAKHKQKQVKTSRVLDEFIAETCTFKPEINANKEKRNKAKTPDVSDRLYDTRKQWDKNREEREIMEKNYDMKTGQKLFAPVIKKDKYYERAKLREQNENQVKVIPPLNEKQQKQMISDAKKPIRSLIMDDDKKRNQKSIIVESERKILKNSSSDKTLKQPTPVKNNEKEDGVLKELFKSLDANKDGLISRNQLDFSKLDDDLLEIIANLALEGFPAKEALDFDKFVRLLEQMKIKESLIRVFFYFLNYNIFLCY